VLNIRVNNMIMHSGNQSRIFMDIDSCTITGLYGEKKHELITLLSGLESFDGDVVLDTISLKGSHEEYLEQIAVITKDSIINTELSVNDFLDFFGSMDRALDDSYEARKKKLLQEFGLLGFINIGMNFLKEIDRKKVKLISFFLKDRSLLLLDTFLESFHKNDLKKLLRFLKDYVKNERIVIIGSDNYKFLERFSERIYEVN